MSGIIPSALAPTAATSGEAVASGAATYTDAAGLAALKNAPPSPATLHAVTRQVEALFLQMMLKSMREAGEAAGVEESSERGMYEDMFDKQVALSLAGRQDLGFGRLLERQLGGAGAAAPGPSGPQPSSGTQAPSGARAPLATGSVPRAGAPDAVPAAGGAGAAAGAASAGAPRSTTPSADGAAEFVRQVLPSIRQAARVLGVSPLGLLAQAALETGWGQRIPAGRDGASSLNLFGIKAGEDWAGPRVVADTVEFASGLAQPKRQAFRAYGSIEESVADFARLLGSSPRYRSALQAGASAAGYVTGIAQSGYATDPEYGIKLSRILASGTLRSALGRQMKYL